jgi:ABC-type dipeptide/oligopeptide/nickel transport system permease subunit
MVIDSVGKSRGRPLRAGQLLSRIGLAIFVLACLLVLFAPVVSPYAPDQQFRGQELMPPSSAFLFGTDDLGRDILTRSIYGAQLSLFTGLLAAAISGDFGVILGMYAGYRGGLADKLLGRLFDTILAFPGLLLGLGVAVLLGKGLVNAALAAAIINLPLVARLTRAAVLSEKEREYVLAARAIGMGNARIMILHLLPNVLPVLLVQITLTVADAMIIEAGLSFLGLGAQPPQSSLGIMLRDSRNFLAMAPWYALFPGLFLTVFLVSLSFISNALTAVFNPRGHTAEQRG